MWWFLFAVSASASASVSASAGAAEHTLHAVVAPPLLASPTMSILSTCTGVERPVYWADGCLHLLDQRELPAAFTLFAVHTVAETIRAIKDMAVRGAPAIGAAGAFGLVLAAHASVAKDP